MKYDLETALSFTGFALDGRIHSGTVWFKPHDKGAVARPIQAKCEEDEGEIFILVYSFEGQHFEPPVKLLLQRFEGIRSKSLIHHHETTHSGAV